MCVRRVAVRIEIVEKCYSRQGKIAGPEGEFQERPAPNPWQGRQPNIGDDLVRLKDLLTGSSPKRQEWEYKLRGGSIIIYVPIIPWNSETRKPDPSMRYMSKHLRIVSVSGGPFQLEYMRHTGPWSPMFDTIGDLETVVKSIEEDPLGICGMFEPPENDKAKRGSSRASSSSKTRTS